MEDLYAPDDTLQDYMNEYFGVAQTVLWESNLEFDEIRNELNTRPIKTPEERQSYPKWNDALAAHPEKVARLDILAAMANACDNLVTFMQIYNEVARLLYGLHSDRLILTCPQFHPDNLNV